MSYASVALEVYRSVRNTTIIEHELRTILVAVYAISHESAVEATPVAANIFSDVRNLIFQSTATSNLALKRAVALNGKGGISILQHFDRKFVVEILVVRRLCYEVSTSHHQLRRSVALFSEINTRLGSHILDIFKLQSTTLDDGVAGIAKELCATRTYDTVAINNKVASTCECAVEV